MIPISHVAVQHGHLPFIFPFRTSWLTSHLVCEIFQILLDIYLAYSWNIQVQVSDWIEYSKYMISIWQYKLDIYPLDLYIWHIPDIRLLRILGGHHVTPYVCNIYHIYIHQVRKCHIYVFFKSICLLQKLAWKFQETHLNQTCLSLKSIMQLTMTISPDSASFI